MKSEWRKVTIEECTSLLGDGLHGTPQYTVNGEYAFVNGNNLIDGKIVIKQDTKRVDSTQYEKYKKQLNNRTILVSINGTLGNVATYNGEKIILGKSACYFNVVDTVDKNFIKYIVSSPNFRTYLETNATGTTIKNISLKQMREFSFYIPDLDTQQKISALLKSIDDKVALNTKINENLEHQMSEYFKMMFPDILNDSGQDTLERLISFSNGKKRPAKEGDIPVFGGNGILAYTNKSNSSNCVIIGRVGAYCGNVSISLGDCWISDNAISAKSKVTKSQLFIYYILKNASLPSRHIGTGQPLMTQGILNAIPCNMPQINNIEDFERKMIPLQNLIEANKEENQYLASIRDALLPKLMNGEIDVSAVHF